MTSGEQEKGGEKTGGVVRKGKKDWIDLDQGARTYMH